MENLENKKNLDDLKMEEIKLNDVKRHIYKFIFKPFSFESSNHFTKIHKRRFNSFGCIHELGKLPGAMF